MPKSISHRKLVSKLKRAGATGPFYGGKHPFMRYGKIKIFIPNPHGADIGSKIVKRIIEDMDLSEDTFDEL